SEPPAPPPPPAVVVADWACTMTSGAEVLSSVGHVRCSSGFFSQHLLGGTPWPPLSWVFMV
ncbi:MAG TPA: hypothetical protein VFD63_04980, partial [Pyrinomonadaceae bacterium]|nr:hypothetical protein [Pyrinomonadaceae bacterium]